MKPPLLKFGAWAGELSGAMGAVGEALQAATARRVMVSVRRRIVFMAVSQ